jgi:hypothetical protein
MPPLLIVAPPDIPEAYWVPQPPKLDRQALLADLKWPFPAPSSAIPNLV